ncbi:hypothetical protein GCM10011578_070180 [Streptomyces fuscichromogenes]|uniref:Transposase IS204/IS1001/IS1096/IS1165 DDE domain-containing protein n=1 Tax=Streptomyces fuscichromogenes TaxID=1324013 RepID=A0A918CV98_9ACTN|nr:hypothetical protein GCM10011578_070180 [Streptomyces fuscichromogenes]
MPEWIRQAEQDAPKPMKGFAGFLRQDLDAVTAGLTLPWSSGVVEGHVNRVKTLKRAMYGRASFALLRTRILTQQRGLRLTLASCAEPGGKGRYQGVRPQQQFRVGSSRHADRNLITAHGLGKVNFKVMVRSDEWIAVPTIRVLIIGGLKAEFDRLPVGAIEAIAGVTRQESQEGLDAIVPDPALYRAFPVALRHPARVPHTARSLPAICPFTELRPEP